MNRLACCAEESSASLRRNSDSPTGAWCERGQADVALIRLHKTNEAGEDAGALFVTSDHIVAITTTPGATELELADGHTRWVKDSPEDIVSLIKNSA
jgi:hypothetical protein